MSNDLNAVFYSQAYHPIQAGSIDGTDTAPHDNGVYRAVLATSTGLYDPMRDEKAQGDPYCVVFVGRLARETTESTIEEVMSKYGRIKNLRLVRHIVTGASQGYAFVEYETEKEMRRAYEAAYHIRIDGRPILVDYNRQLLMPGWIPRRLGGGLGGRKESGQLRFGGRDRPFRKPLRPIPEEELGKLGIPLPGNYMSRFEMPPLPKRRLDISTRRTPEYGSNRADERRASNEHSLRSPKREDGQRAVIRQDKSPENPDSRRRHHSTRDKRNEQLVEDEERWHQQGRRERRESRREDDGRRHRHHEEQDESKHRDEEDDRRHQHRRHKRSDPDRKHHHERHRGRKEHQSDDKDQTMTRGPSHEDSRGFEEDEMTSPRERHERRRGHPKVDRTRSHQRHESSAEDAADRGSHDVHSERARKRHRSSNVALESGGSEAALKRGVSP